MNTAFFRLGTQRAGQYLRFLLPAGTEAPAEPDPVSPTGKKILVVDDDPVILKTMSLKLRSAGYAVADVGLKALGMDHGDPTVVDPAGSKVWFCSDEHLTFSRRGHPGEPGPAVGDRVRVHPGHIDPTVAYHERMHVVRDDEVIDIWPVDLRNW